MKGQIKIREHLKKYRHVYGIEVILIVIAVISGLLVHFFGDFIGLLGQLIVFTIFLLSASMFFPLLVVRMFLANDQVKIINTILTRLKELKKINKTPRIFEFGFFVFLFWATFFLSTAYSKYETIDNIEKALGFLGTFWYYIVFYGFALACGFLHYLRRLDD